MMPDMHIHINITVTTAAAVTACSITDEDGVIYFAFPIPIPIFISFAPFLHLSHSLPSPYSFPTPFICPSYTHSSPTILATALQWGNGWVFPERDRKYLVF